MQYVGARKFSRIITIEEKKPEEVNAKFNERSTDVDCIRDGMEEGIETVLGEARRAK